MTILGAYFLMKRPVQVPTPTTPRVSYTATPMTPASQDDGSHAAVAALEAQFRAAAVAVGDDGDHGDRSRGEYQAI
jgi:hypothetical protein